MPPDQENYLGVVNVNNISSYKRFSVNQELETS